MSGDQGAPRAANGAAIEAPKPCPFCGGVARRRSYATPEFTEQWVECTGCEARSATVEGDPYHVSPVPLWNARSDR